jgi:hypothetical protein
MSRKVLSLLLLTALTCALVLVPATAAAQAPPIGTLNVTGPVGGGNTFTGTFTIDRFVRGAGNQLTAVGTVSGTVTNAAGQVVQTITNTPASAAITNITATCQILNLVLGPLHLDLLGLVVDLNQVVLVITADAAGGLLGQLLSGLLCSTNPSNLLINLLNQILRLGRL